MVSGIAGMYLYLDYLVRSKLHRAVFAVRDIPFGKNISADDVAVYTFGSNEILIDMVGYQSNVESVIGQVAERDIQKGQEIIKLKSHKGMTGSFFSHGALKWDIDYLNRYHSDSLLNRAGYLLCLVLYCNAFSNECVAN